jgi:hypothetical protein
MRVSDILTFIFLASILGLFGYIIADIVGLIVFSTIIAYILFTIVCWIKYGRKYGVYRLPAFCMYIFNSNGELIASFKGDDWTVLENPLPLTYKETLTVKVRNKQGQEEEKTLDLDYNKMFEEFMDNALKTIIPDPKPPEDDNPSSATTTQKVKREPYKLTFEKVVENAIRASRKWKLLSMIENLPYEEKLLWAQLMRKILASHLIVRESLKVYKITSLTNEIYLIWVAQAEPQQYYTYSEKHYFKKWKVWLSRKGLPVIEAWGAEMRTPYKGKLMPITYEIQGYQLKCFFCMPIQDERYRYLRLLLMQQYEIIASAVSKYIQEMLDALPYISRIDLITKERDIYREEVEIYREGIQQIFGEISELSSIVYRAFSLVSQLSGLLATIPLPKETKQKLSELGITVEEQKSRLERLASAVKSLIIREKKEEGTKPESGIEIKKAESKEGEGTKIG